MDQDSIPFWIANLSPLRRQLLNYRWSSALTQKQLQNPWQQVVLSLPSQPGQPPVWRVPIPGLVTLKKISRKVKAQSAKASGSDGGPVTFKGLENPTFDIDIELYTPDHWDQWLALDKLLVVTGKPQNRQSYVIEHPLCNMTKVRQIIVIGLEPTLPQAGGPLAIKMTVLAWQNTPGATKTAKAAPQAAPAIQLATSVPKTPSLVKFITAPGPSR